MAFTKSELDAINKAIASGTREVQFEGRKITYDSFEMLVKRKRMIEADLGITTSAQKKSRKIKATQMKYDKGIK